MRNERNEEILDHLASLHSGLVSGTSRQYHKQNNYTRAELLNAALYGINELHIECVELLAKHSPFKKVQGVSDLTV